jgi:hypothetical protein
MAFEDFAARSSLVVVIVGSVLVMVQSSLI